MFDLHYAARSDLGLGSKERNEDSGYAGPNLLLLCDGMGGHAGGDTASAVVVHHLAELDGDTHVAHEVGDTLLGEIAVANERLAEIVEEHPETRGMGTTCIALLRSAETLAIAHIGDSRAYRLHESGLTQITHDHSFLQLLIDQGHLTEEEAWGHPQRSLITRVLSGRPDDEPDHGVMPLTLGDRFLLCSDGLSDYVRNETIHEVLAAGEDPGETAQTLVDLARRAGTRDNVTVVVADVVRAGAAPSTTPQTVGAAARLAPGQEHLQPAEDDLLLEDFREPESQDAPTQAVPIADDGSITLDGRRLVIGERAFAPRTITRESLVGSTSIGVATRDDGEPVTALSEDEDVLDAQPRAGRGGGRRWLSWLIGLLALLLLAAGAVWWWASRSYFLTEADGRVEIRRGLDLDLAGRELSVHAEESDVKVSDLPGHYAERVREGIAADDLDDARERLDQLRERAAKDSWT
ncbi:protein phosphatase [Kytococcus aerolatus]|uniref:Protein phosphatase n=1 Tax=Kytococcus aerolatus TaxID=592308 RepID=A0A212TGF4_9MICO|nr:protein phosphatase 2C domain-containing protein [Kytococcus aerolatus]SNC65137.1 protein phosphatase [Kytococcus aerolatus]